MSMIDDLLRDVRQGFIYTPDEAQFEKRDDWRSHADEIDRPWRGDCDDAALTCAEVAVRRGIDPARVRVALCLTEVGQRATIPPPADHMVCLIDDEGGTWALDNRQRRVEPWDRLGYRWHSTMRLSERGTWREMADYVRPVEIALPVPPVPPVPAVPAVHPFIVPAGTVPSVVVPPMKALTATELRLARVDARLAERSQDLWQVHISKPQGD